MSNGASRPMLEQNTYSEFSSFFLNILKLIINVSLSLSLSLLFCVSNLYIIYTSIYDDPASTILYLFELEMSNKISLFYLIVRNSICK